MSSPDRNMTKIACTVAPAELGRVVIRWCGGGKERQLTGLARGRRLRRRHGGGTIRLGNRRRRLTLRRLVRWSQVRWRVVMEFFGPLKKAVMEIASGRQLVEQQGLSLRFIYSFPFPLV
ncbi:hypothetical protein COCNU_02G008050 [Cocos nucifera]|uniref:Uncharacterized protein n=1 Tax=Cocos nucifera TaxID=13894 RepID=A0A8K0HZR6_COCNU|nr:hypothetical protein COCNU_02G008050 [Cocos nucifera]